MDSIAGIRGARNACPSVTSILVLVVCAHLSTSTSLAQKQTAASQGPTVVWNSPATAKAEDYVGVEICSACHQDQAQQFSKTVHAKAAPSTAKVGTACESCHGPGKAHSDAMMAASGDAQKTAAARKLIYSFRGKPADNAAGCLRCHSTSHDQSLFSRSQHKLVGVSCEQCHSAHLLVPASENASAGLRSPQEHFFQVPALREETRWLHESLLKKRQPDLCFGCHSTIAAKFTLPAHHRVPEGFMKCTDCHSPHGTLNISQLRKVNFEVCTGCHTEKRGPYVYEHPAVRVEGCTACHSPHGTVERHLLLRTEGRFLCLQCHVDPQAANVPHGRLGFQTLGDCTRCHATIHGSNVNQFFLQ
ncbi:MAG: cytochrome c3 family protein [Bryobacteraceae bacterium]